MNWNGRVIDLAPDLVTVTWTALHADGSESGQVLVLKYRVEWRSNE